MSRKRQRNPDRKRAESRTDVRIGVCHGCGRYGQLDTETDRCTVAPPTAFADRHHFDRVRYCQRVVERRGPWVES